VPQVGSEFFEYLGPKEKPFRNMEFFKGALGRIRSLVILDNWFQGFNWDWFEGALLLPTQRHLI